jgi:hypothetical protein
MTEGKIDKDGYLWIKRGSKMLTQYCCYTGFTEACRHYCPALSDPVKDDDGRMGLWLCGGTYILFDKFVDERE